MKKTLCSLLLTISSSPILSHAESPSFNYMEGGYTQKEDHYGYLLRGSFELNEWLYFGASYTELERNRSLGLWNNGNVVTWNFQEEIEERQVDIGVKYAINPNTVVFGEINYLDSEKTPFHYDHRGHAWGTTLGIRSMINPNTELYAKTTYLQISHNNDMRLTLGAKHYFSDSLGIFVEYNIDDSNPNEGTQNGHSVGISYRFN